MEAVVQKMVVTPSYVRNMAVLMASSTFETDEKWLKKIFFKGFLLQVVIVEIPGIPDGTGTVWNSWYFYR